jgi:hypothetical protein
MSAETPTDAAALRAEIEQIRANLGETVAALAAKTDVKARAKDAISEARYGLKRKLRVGASTARDSLDEAGVRRPMVVVGATIGALVGVVIYFAIRRRP